MDRERAKELFFKLETREDVASILGISERSLRYFLYKKRPENMYHTFEIPKKDGSTRNISAPDKELKGIQRKLADILATVYEPKICAYGFIDGKNNVGNAKQHSKKRVILNIDLKDFFSQIHFGRVRGLLMGAPYRLGDEAATTIAQIACFNGKLPQGAPSSPIITNMICAPLDNIPCIHRTFSITYGCAELFIPVRDIKFMIDSDLRKGWLQFQVDERYANGNSMRYAPKRYEKVAYQDGNKYLMRRKTRFDWDIHTDIKNRLEELSAYHGKARKDFHYIFGDTRLWYIKKEIFQNTHILKRNSLSLIFASMHWLSELVRYNPEKFNDIMKTKQNWLIHEFVDNALYQFVDEISCEITNEDIMTTGYRK